MLSFHDPSTKFFENGWSFFLDLKDITVFIVDDDDSVRRSLNRLIKFAGFKAMTFGSAQEFIESGQYLSTGILILDVCMPKMSALEL